MLAAWIATNRINKRNVKIIHQIPCVVCRRRWDSGDQEGWSPQCIFELLVSKGEACWSGREISPDVLCCRWCQMIQPQGWSYSWWVDKCLNTTSKAEDEVESGHVVDGVRWFNLKGDHLPGDSWQMSEYHRWRMRWRVVKVERLSMVSDDSTSRAVAFLVRISMNVWIPQVEDKVESGHFVNGVRWFNLKDDRLPGENLNECLNTTGRGWGGEWSRWRGRQSDDSTSRVVAFLVRISTNAWIPQVEDEVESGQDGEVVDGVRWLNQRKCRWIGGGEQETSVGEWYCLSGEHNPTEGEWCLGGSKRENQQFDH